MSRWHHYFHLAWSTQYRQPLLTGEKEQAVFRCIVSLTHEEGYELLEINGMPDHVHLLIATGPKVDTSLLMKRVKGVTSAMLNDMTDHASHFRWQNGYYSATITPSHLPKLRARMSRTRKSITATEPRMSIGSRQARKRTKQPNERIPQTHIPSQIVASERRLLFPAGHFQCPAHCQAFSTPGTPKEEPFTLTANVRERLSYRLFPPIS